MSILNPTPSITPSPCAVAGMLKARARGTFEMLVRSFNDGAKAFWVNPNASPEDIAECLGTDGKELFQLHAKIGALLAEIKPEAIAEGASVIGQVSYADDGKVAVQRPLP